MDNSFASSPSSSIQKSTISSSPSLQANASLNLDRFFASSPSSSIQANATVKIAKTTSSSPPSLQASASLNLASSPPSPSQANDNHLTCSRCRNHQFTIGYRKLMKTLRENPELNTTTNKKERDEIIDKLFEKYGLPDCCCYAQFTV